MKLCINEVKNSKNPKNLKTPDKGESMPYNIKYMSKVGCDDTKFHK
jgi:hypothetical protein